MTGLKLWMLLLFLHGTNGVEYCIKTDGEQRVTIYLKDFSVLPEGIMNEGMGFEDICRAQMFGPNWLEQSDHRELFKEILRELDGESVTSLRLDHDSQDYITICVVPPWDNTEENPHMKKFLNEIALRVIRVVEAHFKIKCVPTTDENQEWFEDRFLPPAPVLPPEGWQPFYYLDIPI